MTCDQDERPEDSIDEVQLMLTWLGKAAISLGISWEYHGDLSILDVFCGKIIGWKIGMSWRLNRIYYGDISWEVFLWISWDLLGYNEIIMVRETYCLDRLFDWEKKKTHKQLISTSQNEGIMDRTWLVDGSDIRVVRRPGWPGDLFRTFRPTEAWQRLLKRLRRWGLWGHQLIVLHVIQLLGIL